MAFDFKTATPDSSFPAGGFLFGADSSGATDPSLYSADAYRNYLLGLAQTWTATQTIALGTITAAANNLAATATWNNSGVTFTALDLNITDTASNAASLLLDLRVGGASQFSVFKDGSVRFISSGHRLSGINGFSILPAAGGTALWQCQNGSVTHRSDAELAWSSTNNPGGTRDLLVVRDAANTLAQRNGTAAQTFRLYNSFTDASNFERAGLLWTSNVFVIETQNSGTGSARDLYLSRAGGNQIIITASGIQFAAPFLFTADNARDIGASGANRPRNLYMGSWIRFAVTTVGSLPAAGTAGQGARMLVTDANATTFQSVVAGGGANIVPVYSDGTNWRIG